MFLPSRTDLKLAISIIANRFIPLFEVCTQQTYSQRSVF